MFHLFLAHKNFINCIFVWMINLIRIQYNLWCQFHANALLNSKHNVHSWPVLFFESFSIKFTKVLYYTLWSLQPMAHYKHACVSIIVICTRCVHKYKHLVCAQFLIVFTRKVDEKQMSKYLKFSQHCIQSSVINDCRCARYTLTHPHISNKIMVENKLARFFRKSIRDKGFNTNNESQFFFEILGKSRRSSKIWRKILTKCVQIL